MTYSFKHIPPCALWRLDSKGQGGGRGRLGGCHNNSARDYGHFGHKTVAVRLMKVEEMKYSHLYVFVLKSLKTWKSTRII